MHSSLFPHITQTIKNVSSIQNPEGPRKWEDLQVEIRKSGSCRADVWVLTDCPDVGAGDWLTGIPLIPGTESYSLHSWRGQVLRKWGCIMRWKSRAFMSLKCDACVPLPECPLRGLSYLLPGKGHMFILWTGGAWLTENKVWLKPPGWQC